MATRLLHAYVQPLRTPLIAVGLSLGATACFQRQWARPLRLDSSYSSTSITRAAPDKDAQSDVPFIKRRKLNPRAVRQISMGSILGVLAGLGVSVFSKPLAVILGLLIAGVQVAERYGIHVVPYKQMQRYVKGIDLRSALQENVPFKVSFGVLFALTGFFEFSSGI